MQKIVILILALALMPHAAAFAESGSDVSLQDRAHFYGMDIYFSKACHRAGLTSPSEEEIKESRDWPKSQYKMKAFQTAIAREAQFYRHLEQKSRKDLFRMCGEHLAEIERRTWATQGLIPATATIEAAQEALLRENYVLAGQIATALMSKVNFTDGIILLARSYAGRAAETPLLAYAAEHWFVTANLRGRADTQLDIGILRATTLSDLEEAYKWVYALSVDGRASTEERKLGAEFVDKIGARLPAAVRSDIQSWVDAFWRPQRRKK